MEETLYSPKMADFDLLNNLEKISSSIPNRVLKIEGYILRVGHIRSLRSGEQVLKEALQGDEVAIAISEATVGRQISEGDVLYIEMDERAILKIREASVKLDPIEEDIIAEMQKIKKKDQPFWAR